MYGAIIGDICGSIYEHRNLKTDKPETINLINSECHFTDDTVLTCAVAEAVLTDHNFKAAIYKWANKYPNAGYGSAFENWFRSENPQPYNSWGNGSAMRVSPIGWTARSLDDVLHQAERSADITHNHPEGIKGSQSVAAAIFLARRGNEFTHDYSKEDIKDYIERSFGYNLSRTLDEIRPGYKFNSSCLGSVPEAIIAFLESRDFTHAIQLAISIGGDSDTIACITGSIAEAFYRKIPDELIEFAHSKVSDEMKPLLADFCHKYTKSDKHVFPEYYLRLLEKEQRKQLIEQRKQLIMVEPAHSIKRQEIIDCLKELAEQQPPTNLSPGACCYMPMMPETCNVCGGTYYAKGSAVESFENAVRELKKLGLDVTLEIPDLCPNCCNPPGWESGWWERGAKFVKFGLVIQYADDKTPFRLALDNIEPLRKMISFLQGRDRHDADCGKEQALAEMIPELCQSFGIDFSKID